jgi:hypothetical protein
MLKYRRTVSIDIQSTLSNARKLPPEDYPRDMRGYGCHTPDPRWPNQARSNLPETVRTELPMNAQSSEGKMALPITAMS